MDQTKAAKIIIEVISKWEDSQQSQTSGYEYEKSFVEIWQSLGQKIFQESLGIVSKDKNVKKNF